MLDFARGSAQKQFQVQPIPVNAYTRWRSECGLPATLRETAAGPSEKFLQAIWQHQRLRREHLRTLDGKSVRVLHPGFISVEGGPDFRGAILQFDSAPPLSGDVEIDLADSGWRGHGHARNPAFKNVILHVVWQANASSTPLATLALRDVLDAPLADLAAQLEFQSLRTLPENLIGRCRAPLQKLEPDALAGLLRAAAQVRLHNKAAQLETRARAVGWEQAWWEGLFRSLGYKHNRWPMQHLAEIRKVWGQGVATAFPLQARLFGLSGLLPLDLRRNRSTSDAYLRRIWDVWWRERENFAPHILPRSVWRLHGLRPANQPLRRLALAAHWVQRNDLITSVEAWSRISDSDSRLTAALVKIFRVPADPFWSWHWTFNGARLKQSQPLIGAQRITDLAVNTVLPWLLARASAGGNTALADAITRRYHAWPAAEDNATLRLARQRLLGRSWRGSTGLKTASAQQGLLQIVRDFCDHSNALCDSCRFPELVTNWSVGV
ncbi:MAG: DUF2851 family protein [Verrucomicrobiae bacterium]|nr:DUF2851 family protein [Verrucomicrobiae bacterium]